MTAHVLESIKVGDKADYCVGFNNGKGEIILIPIQNYLQLRTNLEHLDDIKLSSKIVIFIREMKRI